MVPMQSAAADGRGSVVILDSCVGHACTDRRLSAKPQVQGEPATGWFRRWRTCAVRPRAHAASPRRPVHAGRATNEFATMGSGAHGETIRASSHSDATSALARL